MGLFRRRDEETLNERLLREAGLDRSAHEEPEPEPTSAPEPPMPFDPYAGTYAADPGPTNAWTGAGVRPAEGDTLVTTYAPAIGGDVVEFVTLPDGDVIVDVEQGDADLSPLAEAIELELRPPYRASGRRQEGALWALSARSIDVRRFVCKLGDELVLVCRGRHTMLQADGVPTAAWLPELQRAGEAAGTDYVVEATRLDGDLWEVRVSAL